MVFVRRSLTVYNGLLTHEETSAIQNRPWVRPEEVLGIENRNLDYAPPATSTRSKKLIKISHNDTILNTVQPHDIIF